MKKTLIILISTAGLALGQSQSQVDAAALAAAIQQNQQLQSYGDAWAARHGYQYNPWTSYYQHRDERQGQSSKAALWLSVIDEDR